MTTQLFTGNKEYFPEIPRILYEGPDSDNPLAFKAYNESEIISGKTMAEHLRFSVCYWHSFCADGSDSFGSGTRYQEWNKKIRNLKDAEEKLDAAFEFFSKITVPFYCFHDRDIAPEGSSINESESNLQKLVVLAKERQNATNIKLLWGTANLFSHPRYMNGAATNPDFSVLTYAAAQVKAAIDATIELKGENYVFWGGREGYAHLFNTDTSRELKHLAQFLAMARDYARSNGFKGTLLIEPKPMEPMKHQYDFDAQTVIGFLRHFDLDKDFKLNIEANHATLAGHSFAHDLKMSSDANLLGSIDANRGDPQNGWDTDQFPTDLYDCIYAMMIILENGGFETGGLNFDAKLRRESIDIEDIFIAHIGGMDTFARALKIASRIISDQKIKNLRESRYASFDYGEGKEFEKGNLDLIDLRNIATDIDEIKLYSGKQELVENLINDYIFK
ncbi:uncharacterized protein METZ01_LOCUS30009 [marine metagenome]|uniref:xylose isomerase n=1 Tax=marine metagenome TaxID=408172 RepID=A0A381QCV6_9ZZZZ|tara:strand:- start:6518 stop:7858 length:1341 start_codon:yes stop_codon:yes gene_type:complete